jgi:hypothetical protein
MAREPYDIFVKEFLQHPAWSDVFEKIRLLHLDIVDRTMSGDVSEFERNRGRAEGVLEVRSLLLGLIQKAKG